MGYEVRIADVAPTTLASTRKRIHWSEIKRNVRPLFDVVYAFLRTAPVKPSGHNVIVYHALSDTEVEMEVGVQVSGTFTPTADVGPSATPGGRAATTTHVGPYDQLDAAYKALVAWCDAQGVKRSPVEWELYGDWEADQSKLRTDLYWLLE